MWIKFSFLALFSLGLPFLSLNAEIDSKIKLLGDLASGSPSQWIQIADIAQLPLTEYTLIDPFIKKRTTYKGVLFRDFVATYGAPKTHEATLIGIDHYMVSLSKAEWERWDILLAIQKNGKYIDISNGGPAQIVFPYHQSHDIDTIKYKTKWIWNINQIKFFQTH